MLSLLAVMFVVAPEAPRGAQWLDNYGVALREAKAERLPLLVILEKQGNPENKLIPVKHSTEESLLSRYKLCRIDVETEYGKRVAAAFQATTFPHTAIIDKTGAVQIFRRSGALSPTEWTATLARYQEGTRPAPVTPPVFESFYRPSAAQCFT